MTLNQIADQKRICLDTARSAVGEILNQSPVIKILPNPKAHLLIDGTFFKRTNCLILYFDSNLKYFQLCRYSTGEKEIEIKSDLKKLKGAGINVTSVTADGKLAIKSALRRIFPEAKFQRCLVHIQRYAETYITQKPKTKAGLELREIAKRLNSIDDDLAKRTWLGCLFEWKRIYANFLKEKTFSNENNRWWYTHKNLRRVIYHIDNALPDMFTHLKDKSIPKDTNGLEGRFSDLKHKFKTHRGLKKEKRENYFAWYIYLKNLKKKR